MLDTRRRALILMKPKDCVGLTSYAYAHLDLLVKQLNCKSYLWFVFDIKLSIKSKYEERKCGLCLSLLLVMVTRKQAS